MESRSKAFDAVKFEKEKATARFNRLRAVKSLWQIIKFAVVVATVTWCSPAVASLSSEFATRVFLNHHVVFLIGNAIIVSLMMLCRKSAADVVEERRDVYDDYVKFSEAACALTPPPPLQRSEEEVAAAVADKFDGDKQIVSVSAECDDVAATIEKAARQIRRFQRTQSEMLRRDISVRPELRRSETERSLEIVSSEAAEIEKLSSEAFRRRVDAFIDKHWSKRASKLEGNEHYPS